LENTWDWMKFPLKVGSAWVMWVHVCWLTNIFNKILSANEMSSEQWRNTLIPIYENKYLKLY